MTKKQVLKHTVSIAHHHNRINRSIIANKIGILHQKEPLQMQWLSYHGRSQCQFTVRTFYITYCPLIFCLVGELRLRLPNVFFEVICELFHLCLISGKKIRRCTSCQTRKDGECC